MTRLTADEAIRRLRDDLAAGKTHKECEEEFLRWFNDGNKGGTNKLDPLWMAYATAFYREEIQAGCLLPNGNFKRDPHREGRLSAYLIKAGVDFTKISGSRLDRLKKDAAQAAKAVRTRGEAFENALARARAALK